MDEKEFMQNLWDVVLGNNIYITQEQFVEKYREYFVELDCTKGEIRLMDEHNEWRLTIQKVWCDNSNC